MGLFFDLPIVVSGLAADASGGDISTKEKTQTVCHQRLVDVV